MLRVGQSWVLRYSVAVFASFTALAVTQLLWHSIQPSLYPFFLAAVMLSSWLGGFGPGLVSTLLGVGFSEYFFLEPSASIAIQWTSLGRISYFISVAVLICALNAQLHHTLRIRQKAEAERNQLLAREQLARQEAESANRAKDEFLAVLSHELRTPLTAITGWIGLLRSGKLDGGRTTLALETIERNAMLQLQLVEDLLDISRIIRGDLWLNSQPVDLAEVVQEAIEVIQPRIEAKQIQLACDLDPSSIFMLGDPDRLQQIVLNVLSNAVKFTPEGGAIAITLSRARDRGEDIQLQVKDTGIGIHPTFLPYVFDHFRQAESSHTRSYKGLGLGLAIAHYLVERQGGTIQAESPGVGQGATFTVKFPPLRSEKGRSTATASHLRSSGDSLNGLSVLVVDDEEDARTWLTTVFGLYQAQVVAVASVDEAVMQFNRFLPDMVVSDIAMPGKDGYALLEELKHWEQLSGRSIPAIALTAHASLADIEKARTAGFWQHLAKPIKAEDLIHVMAKLLESSQASGGHLP